MRATCAPSWAGGGACRTQAGGALARPWCARPPLRSCSHCTFGEGGLLRSHTSPAFMVKLTFHLLHERGLMHNRKRLGPVYVMCR